MIQRGCTPGGRQILWMTVMGLAVLLGGAWAWGQDQTTVSTAGNGPAPTAAGVPGASGAGGAGLNPLTGELPTFAALFNTSPIINGLIFGLSAVSLLIFIYLLITINTRAMMPATFIDDVTKLILARQYEQAANLCRNHRRIFIASIIQRCVENAGKEHSVIMDMIDSEGRRRADVVWNRLSYLADVANIAPMLGLLGTVVGMLQAFFVLPSTQSMSINSRLLATAIGGALATTFFGLIVAIVTVVFYTIVKGRATRTLAEIEQVVHSVADHIKRGGA